MGVTTKKINKIRSSAKHVLGRFWSFLLFFTVWCIFSYPYIFKGLVPFPSKYLVTFFPPWNASYGMPVKNNAMPDVITQIYPWKKLTIESWKHGEVPLWNPYSFAGTPHAANYQSAIFSPFNILYLLFPFIDAWSLTILFQPLLAGIGMYIYLRSVDRSVFSSVLSAVAFSFCGFIVVWMAYGTLAHAALWLPYAFFSIRRFVERHSPIYGILLSVSMASSFLSGHFQISLYVLLAGIVYVVFESWRQRKWKLGIFALLYVAGGVFLCAPQLFLSYEAFGSSVRSVSFGKGEVIPWQYLITIFAPDYYGNPVTRNDWYGHYAEWASYVGVVPFIFFLYSLLRKKDLYVRFFLVFSVVALSLAYPTLLNDLLYILKVPVLATSAASRIIILFSFSLCVIASFGLDGLVDDWKKNNRLLYTFCISIIVGISILWILTFFGKIVPQEHISVAKRNIVLPTIIAVIVLFFMILGNFLTGKKRMLILVALLGIGLFDSLRYASKWMPFEPREYLYPQVESLKVLKEHIGNDRVFGNIGGEVAVYSGIPVLEGYDAVFKERYGKFMQAISNGVPGAPDRSVVVLDKHGRHIDKIFSLLDVRYIYHRVSDGRNVWAFPFWEYDPKHYISVFRDNEYELLENTEAYPRAFLASSYKVASGDDVATSVFDESFNRRDSLVLESSPKIEPQEGPGEAQIIGITPNTIHIKTSSEVPKLLFLSDSFDPGWVARVDHIETPIYRADYSFKAIALTPGEHMVEFVYWPTPFTNGLVVSAGAFISLGGLSLYLKKYAHRFL